MIQIYYLNMYYLTDGKEYEFCSCGIQYPFGCFQFLTTMNKATINILTQDFYLF